jgi:SET domain-containing protein
MKKIRFQVPTGIAIFNLASRFNHACPPSPVRNVAYHFDVEKGVMVFTVCAEEPIPAGAELFISYGGTPAELYTTYGFRCGCGGCRPLTDEDLVRMVELEFGKWEW